MSEILVVCGYGCHLVPELRMYLDRVIRYCTEKQPDLVILCGGYTQRKSAPGKSEAMVMQNYIQSRLQGLLWEKPILLEEDSYTTPDNIRLAAQIIDTLPRELANPETELTVFCEASRALKVDLLVRHFMRRRANIETASWEQMSPQKQIISTLKDWAGILFPPLDRFYRAQRLKRAEQI